MKLVRTKWAAYLGATGIALAWLLIYNSPAYQRAEQFVYASPQIASQYGQIKHNYLYVANVKNGRGRFKFYIVGDKKSGGISISADEIDGAWIVGLDE